MEDSKHLEFNTFGDACCFLANAGYLSTTCGINPTCENRLNIKHNNEETCMNLVSVNTSIQTIIAITIDLINKHGMADRDTNDSLKDIVKVAESVLNELSPNTNNQKYFILKHTQRFGDYEFLDTEFVKLDANTDLEQFKHAYAKDARGSRTDDWEEDYNGYWFDGNLSFLPDLKEISKEAFDLGIAAQKLVNL